MDGAVSIVIVLGELTVFDVDGNALLAVGGMEVQHEIRMARNKLGQGFGSELIMVIFVGCYRVGC